MEVANRACRTGWSGCGALVAPCVGPVLTEWCSTKSFRRCSCRGSRRFPADRIVGKCSLLRVQSVSAVLRVAKANGDALCGDAPTNLTVGEETALDQSLAFECTQQGYQLVICHLCHTPLLVNLAVWSDQSQPRSRFCCAQPLAGRQLFFNAQVRPPP